MLAYRFLFAQLVRRELRQKYQGSTLGVLWYLVSPLVLLGVYTFMFGYVFKLQSIPDYGIFVMVGIVVWTFFSQSLLASAESMILQGPLIRKARFPRETIPAASVAVQLVTMGVMLAVLAVLAVAIRDTLSFSLLLLPLLGALLFCFVLGFALVVSVLHAYFRDVLPVLSALLLPWFFITPTLFVTSNFPFVKHHPFVGTVIEWVNPVTPFIQVTRSILYYGRVPDWGHLLYVCCAAAASLAVGVAIFRRMSRELAVVV